MNALTKTSGAQLVLPTLHAGQREAFLMPGTFRVIRAGRRWGKTEFLIYVAGVFLAKGMSVGWFAPNYRYSDPAFYRLLDIFSPVVAEKNKTSGKIKLLNGGEIEVWTLENPNAGRSRRYQLVIFDEAGFGKDDMFDIWERAVKPTLFDYDGMVIAASNTNGVDPKNFLYKICKEKNHGFSEYHARTSDNPLLPLRQPHETDIGWQARREKALADLKLNNPPLVYRQEYEAEFVDFRGEALFGTDKWMIDGKPARDPWPEFIVDTIFATVDTAVKSGQEHDGSAMTIFAQQTIPELRLFILEWDIVQIDGAFLDEWIRGIYLKMKAYESRMRIRYGIGSIFVEDKSSGSFLIQALRSKEWPIEPIDSLLTSKGKDERAIEVVTHHYQGLCKITESAYNHSVNFKGSQLNHFVQQVAGFRLGDKDGYKRADDLADTYFYGLSIGLGDGSGL